MAQRKKSKSGSKAVSRSRSSWFFIIGLFFGTLVSLYLGSLYHQLTHAFKTESQFVPTRVYSDVSRVFVGQKRVTIERRLKDLGYPVSYLPHLSGEDIKFFLRPIDYPPYLIPDSHPQLESLGQQGPHSTSAASEEPVILQFDTKKRDGILQSITYKNQNIPDLYLEPELIATLSKGGDSVQQIRDPLKFPEIPSLVWKAIIAIEDQHFLEHSGLDPKGILRAMWVNLKTLSLAQGGSTITQQLVKNLMERRSKNIFRKINEVFLSVLLEIRFEKEQILERYLNEVYLGQVGNLEVHGVAEGAEHFFGKKLEDLNVAEIALMAGLIRGPGYYSPYRHKERAVERQKLVLKKMVETGQIAEEEAQAALHLPIRLAAPQNFSNKAPYFTDYVKAELFRLLKGKMKDEEILSTGLRVYTTMDAYLNKLAQAELSSHLLLLEKTLKLSLDERLEGALATVDHSTGFIKVLIGGKDYSKSTFNRILNMKRQIGSTFKPIVYLAAFEKGTDDEGIPYGPGYPVEDAPWTLTYDQGRRTWSPRNYKNSHIGWTHIRTALTQSINTVAARLGSQLGVDALINVAHRLGIESSLPRVPSLSLGSAELSPIEVLKVYATLANRGIQDDLTVIRGIIRPDGTQSSRFFYNPRVVFDPAPIDLLTDILQGVFTHGTASSAAKMGFNFPAAGKTGTTNNSRDSWFAGYTPHLTTVVWVGQDQLPENLPPKKKKRSFQLTGANSALPIWARFMKKALESEPVLSFPVSPLLKEVSIDIHSGQEALSNCPPSQIILEKYRMDAHFLQHKCETNWPSPLPAKVESDHL